MKLEKLIQESKKGNFPKILVDSKLSNKKCEPATLRQGEMLGRLLLDILKTTSNGVGLAASQIGIQKRVCAINVEKPFFLINPVIIGSFDRVNYNEGCLSFPGQEVITERYRNIAVNADNLPATTFFNGDNATSLLEVVCIQHEIDHLDGITMFDRAIEKS